MHRNDKDFQRKVYFNEYVEETVSTIKLTSKRKNVICKKVCKHESDKKVRQEEPRRARLDVREMQEKKGKRVRFADDFEYRLKSFDSTSEKKVRFLDELLYRNRFRAKYIFGCSESNALTSLAATYKSRFTADHKYQFDSKSEESVSNLRNNLGDLVKGLQVSVAARDLFLSLSTLSINDES